MYCDKCGAKNTDRAEYCITCGAPLAPPTGPVIKPSSIRSKSKFDNYEDKAIENTSIRILVGCLASVFIVGLLVIGLFVYLGRPQQRIIVQPPPQTTTDNKQSKNNPTTPQSVPLSEFAGEWRATKLTYSNDASPIEYSGTLRFSVEGNKVKGSFISGDEMGVTFDLTQTGTRTLTGSQTDVKANMVYPTVIEISEDRKIIIIKTNLGSGVTSTITASRSGSSPVVNETKPPVLQETTTVNSEDEAVKRVINSSVVKNMLKSWTEEGKKKIRWSAEKDGTSKYLVHGYTDEGDHTATFGWFSVDSKTGKVSVATP